MVVVGIIVICVNIIYKEKIEGLSIPRSLSTESSVCFFGFLSSRPTRLQLRLALWVCDVAAAAASHLVRNVVKRVREDF